MEIPFLTSRPRDQTPVPGIRRSTFDVIDRHPANWIRGKSRSLTKVCGFHSLAYLHLSDGIALMRRRNRNSSHGPISLLFNNFAVSLYRFYLSECEIDVTYPTRRHLRRNRISSPGPTLSPLLCKFPREFAYLNARLTCPLVSADVLTAMDFLPPSWIDITKMVS